MKTSVTSLLQYALLVAFVVVFLSLAAMVRSYTTTIVPNNSQLADLAKTGIEKMSDTYASNAAAMTIIVAMLLAIAIIYAINNVLVEKEAM